MKSQARYSSAARFLEFEVTTPSQRELLAELEAHLEVGDGFTVATLNLDHVAKMRRNLQFCDAYCRHTHVVADGNPIVWLNSIAGRSVELVPGSDLILPVTAMAARLRVPVALFGSNSETLAIAGQRLRELYPNLEIALALAPSLRFDPRGAESDASIDQIGATGVRLCLVALGAPTQEIFAVRASGRLPQCGFVSIGAGLDFLAGTQHRAPVWVRRMAFEWLWRLAGDWRRLSRRYFDCALVLPSLVVSALRARGRTRIRPSTG